MVYVLATNLFLIIVFISSLIGTILYWRLRFIDEYALLRLILTGAGVVFSGFALVFRNIEAGGNPTQLVSTFAGIILAMNYVSLSLVAWRLYRENM